MIEKLRVFRWQEQRDWKPHSPCGSPELRPNGVSKLSLVRKIFGWRAHRPGRSPGRTEWPISCAETTALGICIKSHGRTISRAYVRHSRMYESERSALFRRRFKWNCATVESHANWFSYPTSGGRRPNLPRAHLGRRYRHYRRAHFSRVV